MEKKMKYEEAVRELESIVRRMENDELDVDVLTSQLQRAQRLLKMCKERLQGVDARVKTLLGQEEEQ